MERPILFNTDMVRALLRGQKTVTRREVKLPRWADPASEIEEDDRGPVATARASGCLAPIACPFGVPGDTLWVRETFAWNIDLRTADPGPGEVFYRADPGLEDLHNDDGAPLAWRPSIHMPRRAARIRLRVTSVKVQHLHEITVDDIVAEGVRVPVDREGNPLIRLTGPHPTIDFIDPAKPHTAETFLRAEWASLWCVTSGRASWDANPLVWVVRFERVTLEQAEAARADVARYLQQIETALDWQRQGILSAARRTAKTRLAA